MGGASPLGLVASFCGESLQEDAFETVRVVLELAIKKTTVGFGLFKASSLMRCDPFPGANDSFSRLSGTLTANRRGSR